MKSHEQTVGASDWWKIHHDHGVSQGSVLSPLLFSIAINPIIHELQKHKIGVKLGDIHIPGLLFADDLVVITNSEEELRHALKVLDQWVKKKRFIFNAKKCGILVTRERSVDTSKRTGKWMLGNEEIPEVKTYKYLGVDKEKLRTWKNHVERLVGKERKELVC